MPRIFAARLRLGAAARASGPPAIAPVADVAVGDGDELDVMARAAHLAATPPALSSQSSGWAPKAMMRSAVPRRPSGAGVARGAWARAEAANAATMAVARTVWRAVECGRR